MPLRVLVVDDSVLMRAKITELIERDGDIKVVATASNGLDAMDKIPRFQPDVVTLDVEMPKLDGIATLKRIMSECPSRVIILTGHATHNGEETVRALEMGAVDFVMKPSGSLSLDIESIEKELREKIRASMHVDPARLVPGPASGMETASVSEAGGSVVVIGASTGGPRSLNILLPQISSSLPASILVVQHMPAFFTMSFAAHLDSALDWAVSEVKDGDVAGPGRIFVAPGGRHMEMVDGGEGPLLKTIPSSEVDGHYVPSISHAMKSVAALYGPRTIGVLLTGMGDDGVEGLLEIRRLGGRTIAESEESAIVYGMPRVAIQKGAAEFVLPISKIANKVTSLVLGA